MPRQITVRVRTSARMCRVKVEPNASVSTLKAVLSRDIGVTAADMRVCLDPEGSHVAADHQSLAELGIRYAWSPPVTHDVLLAYSV